MIVVTNTLLFQITSCFENVKLTCPKNEDLVHHCSFARLLSPWLLLCNFFIPFDLALDILNTGSPTTFGDCSELFWDSSIRKITLLN